MIKHKLRQAALQIINDSPLEHIARKCYGFFSHKKGAIYDKQTIRLMKRILSEDSNSIDVGCYRGEILREIIRLSPKGAHFAFEPIPENFSYLKKTFKSAEIYNMALSDHSGETTFHHVIGRPARSGLKKVDYPDKNEVVKEITVAMDSLDNVIGADVPIDFIKIDVEGAELSVLRGGKQIISKYKPVIVFEFGHETAEQYNTTPEMIYDLLHDEFGLQVSLLERLFNKQKSLSKEGFLDQCLINSEFFFVAYPDNLQLN